MKKNDYKIPKEIRSNRVEDLFEPCWIVKTQRSDRIESNDDEGWISLVVFEDSREMLELIGDWGRSPVQRGRYSEVRQDAVNAT